MSDQYNACSWLVDRHVEEGRADGTAIRIGGTSLTYADIHERVQSAAAGLRASTPSRGPRPTSPRGR